MFGKKENKSLGNGFANGYVSNYYQDTPVNAESERLLAKLETLRAGKSRHTLLFSSALMSEGKSTSASLTAISMARHHYNTLLIDFDVRRPQIHEIFNLNQKNGLTDILRSPAEMTSCIKQGPIPYLSVITTGELEANPLEVLNSTAINQFFLNIPDHFTHIIVDSPPVIPVSDALMLSKMVDDVILVVRAGKTSREYLSRAIDLFGDVKVEISGLVVNNMDNALPYQYDHRYHNYSYYKK